MLAAYRSRRLAACKAREEVCYKLIGKASKHLEFLLAVPQSSGDNIVLVSFSLFWLIFFHYLFRSVYFDFHFAGMEICRKRKQGYENGHVALILFLTIMVHCLKWGVYVQIKKKSIEI